MALRLAEEVKESGRTKSIPALNPAERRIVHMKLQDDPTIRSRSVGEGQFKKILIYLPGRGKKSKNG
jgi:spoIIIJ-associated protein